MKENQKRKMKQKKLHQRKLRMVSLKLSRWRQRMLMELMVWRLQRRKDPGPRVDLAKDPEVVTDVAQGLVKDADQGPDQGKDPSDLGPGREDEDLEAGTEEEAEASPEDVLDLEIIRARRARETG